jgi:hypothetical protein
MRPFYFVLALAIWVLITVRLIQMGKLVFGTKAKDDPRIERQAESAGWRSMSTAPRDGSVIELRCTYGVAPWYGLFKWSNEVQTPDGRRVELGKKRWTDAIDVNKGVADESSLSWRPYSGAVENYVDPTHGRQNTDRYWREAVARKYGLPPDYFER